MTCCLSPDSATSLINLPHQKGGDLQAKDEALDNYIRLVINNFFAALDTGIPALGIPVLDPLNLGDITIPSLT